MFRPTVPSASKGPRSLLVESLEARTLLHGLTVITHGFNGDSTSWVGAMADQIAAVAGTTNQVAQYTMTVGWNSGHTTPEVQSVVRDTTQSWATTQTAEAILKIDWTELDGDPIDTTLPSTQAIGTVVGDWLLGHNIDLISPFDGPLHLIGHGRGASMLTTVAQRLATRGIWIDQFTSLDPHPVDGVNEDVAGADLDDQPMSIWSNIGFADNYWRSDSDAFDLNGESVTGAHNVGLSENLLLNSGSLYEHSDVHLWYHGTIGRTSFSDTDGVISIGSNWYSSPNPGRNQSGYLFSRIIGGTRPNDGLAAAYVPGGTGARISVTPSGDQWANIFTLELQGTQTDFKVGDTFNVDFRFQDRDLAPTVTMFLDTDQNPYNGTRASLGDALTLAATGASVSTGTFSADTSGATASASPLYVFAKITDGTHTRYAYLPQTITLSASTSPAVPTNVRASDGAFPDKVAVSWTAVSGATGYEVWRNTSNNSATATRILTPAGTATTANDSTVTPGTIYFYWVKSKNASGTSAFSAPDSGYAVQAGTLPVPANVKATDGSFTDKVRVTWSAVTGANDYEIYRSTSNNSNTAVKINTLAVSTTSFDDTTAQQGTTYFYWVRARQVVGNTVLKISNFSLSDSGFVQQTQAGPSIGSLSGSPNPTYIPSTLTLTANGVQDTATGVAFYFDSNRSGALETGVDQLLGADNSSSGGWTWSGSTSFITTQAQHRFFARAFDAEGVFGAARSGLVWVINRPPTPTGVSASDGAYFNRVAVLWGNVSGESGYEVWRNTSNDSATATRVGSTAANVTSFDDSTAVAGTTYFYWIKSKVTISGTTFAGGFSSGDSGFIRTTPDTVAPTATLTPIPDVTTSVNSLRFNVVYHDDVALDASSISDGDVLVTGPNLNTTAKLVTRSRNTDVDAITATYVIDAPFKPTSNGTYQLTLQAGQVTDTATPPNVIPQTALGSFKVRIAPYTPGIRVASPSPSSWSTDRPISGSFKLSIWNGSVSLICQAVVGIRDGAGNWIGGEPQVVFSGNPPAGSPGTTQSVSFSNLAVPSTPGTYTVWAYEAQAASNPEAVLAFKNQKPRSQDERNRTVGTLRVGSGNAIDFSESAWRVAGAGDFNGDHKSDLAWQNSETGQVALQLLNGTDQTGIVAMGTVRSGWLLSAVGDFNRDGTSDLVWRNYSNGENVLWYMRRGQRIGGADLSGQPDTYWQIRTAGDLNGDGANDLLWQNRKTLALQVWYLSGASFSRSANLPQTRDYLAGSGDMDRDSNLDLIFRSNSNDSTTAWLMAGEVIKSRTSLPSARRDRWVLGGVSNMVGGAPLDLVWRNAKAGQNVVWEMNGTRYVSGDELPT